MFETKTDGFVAGASLDTFRDVSIFCVCLSSYPFCFKYLGSAGILILVSLAIVIRLTLDKMWHLRWPRFELWGCWLGLILLGMSAAYVLLGPIAEARLASGMGSDRGDALMLASRSFWSGQWPYDHLTKLGNHVTPMPGALILAGPFIGIGFGWQTILWFGFFVWMLASEFGGKAATVSVLICSLLGFGVFQDLVANGDFVANALYVCGLLLAIFQVRSRVVVQILAAILGLSLSSRIFYWIVPIYYFQSLVERKDATTARWVLGTAYGMCGIVTLPFFFYAPGRFSPLHVFTKFTMTPWSLPLLLFTVVLMVSASVRYRVFSDLFLDGAFKMMLLASSLAVLGLSLLWLRGQFENGLSFVGHASMGWPFCAIGLAAHLSESERS